MSNYNEYLRLKFSGARLHVGDTYKGEPRTTLIWNKKGASLTTKSEKDGVVGQKFVEKIAPNHIINMLYAFTGQDLVPYFRRTITDHNPKIIKWANDSYIRLDKLNGIVKGEEVISYNKEFICLNKYKTNSNMSVATYSWDTIYYLLLRTKFEPTDFGYDVYNATGLDISNFKTVDSFIKELYNNGLNDVFLKMVEKYKNGSLSKLFTGIINIYSAKMNTKLTSKEYSDIISYNMKNNIAYYTRTVDKYLEKKEINGIGICEVHSGEILLPLNDEIRKLLEDAPLTCTLLDGGMVDIVEVLPSNRVFLDEFTKVSDLSTELIK